MFWNKMARNSIIDSKEGSQTIQPYGQEKALVVR